MTDLQHGANRKMAWIVDFEVKHGTGKRQPSDVIAHVKTFDALEGSTILQIDTLGSNLRERPGKQSQTLQLGPEAAEKLFYILKNTYNFK